MSPYEDWTPTSRWWTPSPNKREAILGDVGPAGRTYGSWRRGLGGDATRVRPVATANLRRGEPALKPTACSQAVARGPIMGSGPLSSPGLSEASRRPALLVAPADLLGLPHLPCRHTRRPRTPTPRRPKGPRSCSSLSSFSSMSPNHAASLVFCQLVARKELLRGRAYYHGSVSAWFVVH